MQDYQPLIDEILQIVLRVAQSYRDKSLEAWILDGAIEYDDQRGFSSTSIPSGRMAAPEPDSTVNLWTPDRRLVVELALRTASARAKRWIAGEQRLAEMPANYHHMIRHADGGERFHCEISIGAGWVDLLLTVDEWLIELGQPAVWGQVKEKYGGARLYPDNSLDDRAIDVIDHAENVISKKICETCGAPGRTRDRSGWYYTSCDEHVRS